MKTTVSDMKNQYLDGINGRLDIIEKINDLKDSNCYYLKKTQRDRRKKMS